MNEEEYLCVCGWMPRTGGWDPPLRSTGGPTYDAYSSPWETADALKRQLTEDRARLLFMLSRTVLRATWPDGKSLTVDLTDATIAMEQKPA